MEENEEIVQNGGLPKPTKSTQENHNSTKLKTKESIDKRKKKEVQWLDNVVASPVKSSNISVTTQKEKSLESSVNPVSKEKFQLLRERFMANQSVDGIPSETYERKLIESLRSHSPEQKCKVNPSDKLMSQDGDSYSSKGIASPNSIFHPNAMVKVDLNTEHTVVESSAPYMRAREYFHNKSTGKLQSSNQMESSYTTQATLPMPKVMESHKKFIQVCTG